VESQLRRHRLVWRAGCIIRSAFLGKIKEAFDRNPKLGNLLLDPYFTAWWSAASLPGGAWWRRRWAAGVPVPAFTTALSFFDGFRSERLPANLLQAQRDYFGAHTYERVDQPRGKVLPHQLDRQGRHVSSSTYTV
jgi:6-phosphogluconate dehydrogenase